MTDIRIDYRTPDGVLIQAITDFVSLEYVLKENDSGILTLVLADTALSGAPFLDGRLEIYRRVGAGGYNLEGDAVWLIRKWAYTRTGESSTLTITAYHANQLLQRRIVAYNADTAYSKKYDQLDDMMKAIVRENFNTLATDTTRRITTYMMVQADLSLAPVQDKAFSRRMILTILQEMAQQSYQAGTYLAFDVVRTGDATVEFKTFTTCRGIDRGSSSSAPLVVSEENGAMAETMVEYDYSDEVTYVYVAGKGEGNLRNVQTASDAARIAASPVNRIEALVDARNGSDLDADLISEGNAYLKSKRPVTRFSGTLRDSLDVMYGVHYGYGDIVQVIFRTASSTLVANVHVDTVHNQVSGGKEELQIMIHGEV